MSNPIKPTLKTEILPIVLIVLNIAASFYFYAHFPERVPTHWNFRGQIDAYSNKAFAAFFFPLLIFGMYLLFLAIPYIDPKKDHYIQFSKVYHIFKGAIIVLLSLIYFYAGLAGLGYNLPINYVVPPAIGLLFIVLGNYMAKIKSNWFFGIRTPWTISSEEVWQKTHRLGGKLFILAGLFLIFGSLLSAEVFWIGFLIFVIVASLVPIVYSYLLYRKIEKNKSSFH